MIAGAPARSVLRGRVVGPGQIWADGVVAVEDELIAWAGAADEWQRGPAGPGWPLPQTPVHTLLPGLVDVHCHGGGGHGFPDGDAAGAQAAARHHLAHGTTTMLASLVTAPEADLLAAIEACAGLCERGEVAGIHLEGPFLSAVRCGAQDPRALRMPDLALLDRLLAAGRGHVRSMTYAPELPGARGLADRALDEGVVVSVGHTDADARTVRTALAQAAGRLGRSSATHLFNGMPPLHHRSPGPVAACLAGAARGETTVELVADGVHLADETVATVFDLVGPDAIALVTDAMAAAGMPAGRYPLGRLDVEVVAGVARLAGDGAPEIRSIAGGTARLVEVLRRCVQRAGVDLLAAVTAASATPARLIGLDGVTGSLRAGLRADVLATDEALRPVGMLRRGQQVRPGGQAVDAGPEAFR